MKLYLTSWARLPYLILVPVLLVGLLPGPVLLGTWESVTFYHAFGAIDAPLSFLIAPRANIGGQGYAFLEMARMIIHFFHLPLNLWTFRIPAVFFGGVSLLLFFTICRRYFGSWPAIAATALLAGNQMFFQVEHLMTVLVISGAALLFVIERLQALEVRYWDLKTWFGLAVSMAFVSLHYGPARILAVLLIGAWFLKICWQLLKDPCRFSMLRGILVLFGYSVVVFLLILTLLDYRNIISILRFSSFLFPVNAEVVALTPSSTEASHLASTLGLNLKILFDSLFGHIGNYHSLYSSGILADFRYPLLNRFVVPFVILGAIVSVIWMTRRTILFASPWKNVLTILGLCLLPPIFSAVVYNADSVLATLSVSRIYFLLFPLHLLIAAFLYWLRASSVGRIGKYGAALCVTAVFCSLMVNLIGENSRFKNQVFALNWQKHGSEIEEIWNDHAPNLDRPSLLLFSHLQQHAQYANVARLIADKLQAQNKNSISGTRRIVFVDVNKFSEVPIAPVGLHYITNRNYHSIFLALYAGQEGVSINPVVMVDPKRKPIAPGLMSGLAYKGRPREYSALTELDKNGRLVYKRDQEIIPVIVELTGDSSYDILVTTPEEEVGARRLFERKHVPYEYVKI